MTPHHCPGSNPHGDRRSFCSATSAPASPDDWVEDADECVTIPMVGVGASLNVAVSGSLVLYRLAGLA